MKQLNQPCNCYIMPQISQREIANRLGLSTATVSRAIHGDPKVHPETARRVLEEVEKVSYALDPVVSAGLSKIRRRSFYRETIAWLIEHPQVELPWLREMFETANDLGHKYGFKIEFVIIDPNDLKSIRRKLSILQAKGVRGILLGPAKYPIIDLDLPWEDFTWVTIGANCRRSNLHHVGRDYHEDIRMGIDWLRERGFTRPGFIQHGTQNVFFKTYLLRSALEYYHGKADAPVDVLCEMYPGKSDEVKKWLERDRPDSLILAEPIRQDFAGLLPALSAYPMVILAPAYHLKQENHLFFTANYPVIGQSAINLMKRLLDHSQSGLMSYQHCILVSSRTNQPLSTPAHHVF
mgnify:CR=1 FL=1